MSDEVKEGKQEEIKEDVAKAFGNQTDPADDEKAKADPKAADQKEPGQKQEGAASAGDDKKQSGKTYTQAEVDAMMAKARKKYVGKTKEDPANGATADDGAVNPDEEGGTPQEEEGQETDQGQDLATGLTIEKYAQAELKASMAIAGVNPKKVQRAVRLIDAANVIENGQFSEEKAKQEIEALLQDWPELKMAENGSDDNAFYFGAPEQAEQNSEEKQKGIFSSIFGNK